MLGSAQRVEKFLGSQTLGEEYTNIWLHSSRTQRRPPPRLRAALILLPTLPSYLLSRLGYSLSPTSAIGALLRRIPTAFEVLSEINLAIFYLRGTYYNIAKRLLGIRHVRPLFLYLYAYSDTVSRSQPSLTTQMRDHHHMLFLAYCWVFGFYIEHLVIFVYGLRSSNPQIRKGNELRAAKKTSSLTTAECQSCSSQQTKTMCRHFLQKRMNGQCWIYREYHPTFGQGGIARYASKSEQRLVLRTVVICFVGIAL